MSAKGEKIVDVMLMSLKAGNLGLNMVCAYHVILLDLWWNPATEDQTVNWAHNSYTPDTHRELAYGKIADWYGFLVLSFPDHLTANYTFGFGDDRKRQK
ncbi:helicase-like transcription factor CHR27, partial [Tanacetum coccineum]